MTKADHKLIDESIQKYGDDFWNDPNDANSNRVWIILDLLYILKKDDLDLKVVRKKRSKSTFSKIVNV